MNLLELMLKENVEWPVVAEFAVQDYSGKIRFSIGSPVCNAKYYQWEGCLAGHGFDCGKKLEKWDETIITREEYQSAGGWMKWEGGKRPVSSGSMVNFVARGDVVILVGIAGYIEWHHCGEESDIIAYRIINQRPVQLDNPEIEPDFEPFVSIEDARECKAEHAATSKQSAPKGSGNPILGMVLADLTNRALEGKEKYGEPLKAHNGRNALWDAYQEALDLAMYLRQLIQEQQDA